VWADYAIGVLRARTAPLLRLSRARDDRDRVLELAATANVRAPASLHGDAERTFRFADAPPFRKGDKHRGEAYRDRVAVRALASFR